MVKTPKIVGIFGSGINYDYFEIKDKIEKIIEPDIFLLVEGRSGIDKYIYRIGQELGLFVVIAYSNTMYQMPKRDEIIKNKILEYCNEIIIFSSDGDNNYKKVEERAKYMNIPIIHIQKSKNGDVMVLYS